MYVVETAQQRWSAAAVAGFVMSLLGCTAPLGLLFGLIGLFTTSGARRKGRGLAIAALIIGVLWGSTCYFLGYGAYRAGKFFLALTADVGQMLQTGTFAPADADRILARIGTNELTAAVHGEDVVAWIAAVKAKHGSFREIVPNAAGSQQLGGNKAAVDFTGKFVNGEANIRVVFVTDGMQMRVDDIEVGGISLRDMAEQAQPGSTAPTAGDDKPKPATETDDKPSADAEHEAPTPDEAGEEQP